MTPHRFDIRVYYEDTDFSGNVYHASYLKFCERGRTEFLRAIGVHHAELAEDGLAFAVREMGIHFDAAARIDDVLTVVTEVKAVSGARLVLEQAILRGEAVITRASVTIVAIRLDGRATRLPQALRDRLAAA